MHIAKFPLIERIVSKRKARKFRDAIICHHCLRRTPTANYSAAAYIVHERLN